MTIPRLSGVDGFRLQWATNFDASFTTMFTAPNTGYVDPAINLATATAQNLGSNAFGPSVRVIFDPATYSITDTKSFWVRFVPVTGGSAGTPGAPTLLLPASSNHGLGVNVIHGSAPSAVDSTGSLQLDLPRLMQDFRIHNEDGANSLYVSTEQNGAEVQLKTGATEQMTSFSGTQGSIWVRGSGGAVTFSATFTTAYTR
jgi:hypothetical protein